MQSLIQPEKLFQRTSIGRTELDNRLVMLPVTTLYGEEDRISQRLIDFYVERARGGVGLIITGLCTPTNLGQSQHGYIGIYEDDFVPYLRALTSAIHAHGAKVMAQVGLAYHWRADKYAPLEFVSASNVVTHQRMGRPRALTIPEIKQIVLQFGEAARRIREAGFDGVEFACHVGYLISRFLSPLTNRRTDEYGGSLENRMRFLLEIIGCARSRAGHDYVSGCRLGLEDFMSGGITIEESKLISCILEKAGIDYISTAVGWHESPMPTMQSSVSPGAFVGLTEQIKKVVHIPVIAAYRINDFFLAESIIAERKADMVGMCRALIADPEFPLKAKEGRFDEIRPCITCCYCLDRVVRGKGLACAVNARAGREAEYDLVPTLQVKRVFIAGGGPAGMEAAAILAKRGHRVTLWERNNILAGKLLVAAVPPYKEGIVRLANYLTKQTNKQNVELKLGEELTISRIEESKPDNLIIATGASPVIPDMPGINRNNVITAIEVLNSGKSIGKDVIVIGGGMVGCETAEFLVNKGCKVTILEKLERIGEDIGPSTRWVTLRRLREAGVKMETKVDVVEVTETAVKAMQNGTVIFWEAETVVVAVGFKPNTELANRLESKRIEVRLIGDCKKPGKISEAIEDAVQIAASL